MRNLTMVFLIFFTLVFNVNAEEIIPAFQNINNPSILTNQDYQSFEKNTNDFLIDEGIRSRKKTEETFINNIKDNILSKVNNKNSFFSENGFYISAFIFGLFFGPIAVLAIYLANRNKANGKSKVIASLLGWFWWMAIFSIILLI